MPLKSNEWLALSDIKVATDRPISWYDSSPELGPNKTNKNRTGIETSVMFRSQPLARRTNANTECSSSSSVPTSTVVASAPSGIFPFTSDSCFTPLPPSTTGSGANVTSGFCSLFSSVVSGNCQKGSTILGYKQGHTCLLSGSKT